MYTLKYPSVCVNFEPRSIASQICCGVIPSTTILSPACLVIHKSCKVTKYEHLRSSTKVCGLYKSFCRFSVKQVTYYQEYTANLLCSHITTISICEFFSWLFFSVSKSVCDATHRLYGCECSISSVCVSQGSKVT